MLNETYTQEELYHWGIKGMKWGVRRFQNKDGSLTAKGRARYADDGEGGLGQKIKDAYASRKASKAQKKQASRSVKDLTDDELNDRIKRLDAERRALDLERQISNMSPKQISAGKAFISTAASQVLKPALITAGKDVLTKVLQKKGMDLAGLGEVKDFASELKKEVDTLNLKKQKDELNRYFNNKSTNSNDYSSKDFSELTDAQIADLATRQKNINIINAGRAKTDQSSGGSSGSKPNSNTNTSASASKPKETDSSSNSTESSTSTTPKTETPKAEFKPSNSNARSVHDIYTQYYKSATGTVDSLYSSGYMMTPVSKLEGTAPSGRVSNTSAWLGGIGDWKMRSLEDMERYN